MALALNATLAAAALAGGLAWRLGEGPLALPWAIPPVEARLAALGYPVKIGGMTAAWNGWRDGADAPVTLSIDRARLGADAAIAEARATVGLPEFLAGRPTPRSLTLDGVHLRVSRTADGRTSVAGAPLPTAAEPQHAGSGLGASWPDGLCELRISGLSIDGSDAGTGLSARLLNGRADLARDAANLLRGDLSADLDAGGRHASIVASATADGATTEIRATLSPVDPASYADLTPALAPLSAFDAPVALTGTASLGPGLSFRRGHLDVTAGSGLIRAGEGTAPILSLDMAIDATPDTLEASAVRFVTAPRPDGPRTTIQGHAKAVRAAAGYAVSTSVEIDRVAMADLPAIWPEGTGGPGTRPWFAENVTGGFVSNARVDADLAIPADLSAVALTRIDGHLDGHDLTLFWLAPVPPLVDGEVRLTVTDPDVIDVAVLTARQDTTDIRFDGASVRLTGIAGNDQFAAIDGPIQGPLADVIRILSHPRLKLLSKSPVPLGDTAGQLRGTLQIGHLPLRDDIALDDLGIVTDAQLRDVRIGRLVAGRDLDHGQLTLHATTEGMSVAGTAAVARVPAKLDVAMDFAAGPPSQVQQTAHVVTTLDPAKLKRLGVDAGGLFSGSFGLDAEAKVRRDGRTDVAATADLTGAGFGAAPLPWRKDAGAAATGEAAATLDRNGALSLHRLRVRGGGIDVDAAAELGNGRSPVVRLRRLRLGTAVDLAGTVALPRGPGGRYVVDVAGPSLDLTGVRKALAASDTAVGKPARAFTATARIDHVNLGDGRALLGVAAHVERDADGLRDVELSGATVGPPTAPFHVLMHPTPFGRRIEAHTDDFGAVLAGFGAFDGIGGGRLDVVGVPKLDAAGHPSTVGVVTLDAFRLRDAPWAARLLKALTLYGIVDLLRGPGVSVTHLTAPFELRGDVLTLREARAVSPSLGVTVKGQVDLGRQVVALRGTVVPAWILNTLPGRLPLIGKMFSPERGGGLVSAMFSLNGRIADPSVSVNPLSLLTPGALRGLFDGFAMPTLPDDPAAQSLPQPAETKLSSQ